MFTKQMALVAAGLMLGFGAGAAYAETEDVSFGNAIKSEGDHLNLHNTNWEFDLHFGYAVAVGNKTETITANNSAFLYSDPGNIGEDEFSENQITPPDFNGTTQLSGDRDHSYMVGLSLYRKVIPWVAVGFEGSYMIQDEIPVVNAGPFTTPIYTTHFRTHASQELVAAKLGGWIGPFRPYVMGGVGPYFLSQSVTAELLDPDDADHPPVEAASVNEVYGSTLIGGGLDIKFLNEGSVGLEIQYQRAYRPGADIEYVIPTARFAYHF